MKILWLVNQPLPAISCAEEIPVRVTEGWLVGLSQVLVNRRVDLVICFPQNYRKEMLIGQTDGYEYYGFYKKNIYATSPSQETEKKLEWILQREKPDVIHLMGTEFSHSYEMVETCRRLNLRNRVIVSIQGITSCYAKVYMGGLPKKIYSRKTLRDILLRDSLQDQKKKMETRGRLETKLLAEVSHVIGRTDWDYQEVKKINPQIRYYKNNENLREIFYRERWSYEGCEPYRIFMGQITYPIKGFHFILEAFSEIKNHFPQAKLYVAGKNIRKKAAWRRTYYQRYLLHRIAELGLEDDIVFLGELSAEKMCEQYLKANVFVLPSIIENSSNALGEAMLLGTPCVAAETGGTPSMLRGDEEGFLYPVKRVDLLTEDIECLFLDPELADQFSQAAREHAKETHDREKNCDTLMGIYDMVAGGEENA